VVSVLKPSQLMLYGEMIAVCSESHTKHKHTLCGQNKELLNVKLDGTYSNQWNLITSDMVFVIIVSDNKN
jgi:phosphodiesterase/alkaline phosphatase D-like protein